MYYLYLQLTEIKCFSLNSVGVGSLRTVFNVQYKFEFYVSGESHNNLNMQLKFQFNKSSVRLRHIHVPQR